MNLDIYELRDIARALDLRNRVIDPEPAMVVALPVSTGPLCRCSLNRAGEPTGQCGAFLTVANRSVCDDCRLGGHHH